MKVLKRTTVGFVLLLACIFVAAQSGRRQTKPAPAAPIPTPTSESSPSPKPQQKEPEIIFYIGADRNHTYNYYPYSYYDAVLNGCAEALRNGSSAGVDVSQNELPRGEAIKKSKASTNTYTVLLQLSDQAMPGTSSSQRYDQVELEYVVFAPGTAKVVTSGRTYQNATRKGPIVVGPSGGGATSGLYREALLKRAGEDAGERILHALHLSVPKTN